jgi:hypothetical protein
MASPIGDNIDLLSTTTPLTAGGTWTSPAVVLGVYNSLVIMIKRDIDSTLYIEWSGDQGVNWDATDTHNIIDTITSRIVITTQQKTMRLRLTNGASNQTYLRLFTYGVTTNNSSLVSLVDSIDVSNLLTGLAGGQTVVSQYTELVNYNFAHTRTTSVTCQSRNLQAGYPDIYTYSANASATCGSSNYPSLAHYLYFRPGTVTSQPAVIMGRGFLAQAGSTNIMRFLGSFDVSDSLGRMIIGCCADNANTPLVANPITVWHAGFGWDLAATKTNDNFSVAHGAQYTPRTSWNIDKCDGNSTLPAIDFTNPDKPNYFQAEWTMGGNIRFSIMNPSTNKFSAVHQVNTLNTDTVNIVGNRSVLFAIYGTISSSPGSGTDEIRCSCYNLSTDLPIPRGIPLEKNISFDVAVAAQALDAIALQQVSSLGGIAPYTVINLNSISISANGLNPVTVKFFLDSTVTGGSWTVDNVLPFHYNTTASITPSTSNLIYQFELGNNDSLHKEFNPLNSLLYGFRYVTIQVSSKSTSDVRICLGLSQS